MKTMSSFRRVFQAVLASLTLSIAAGCSYSVDYNRAYLGNPDLGIKSPVAGKGAILSTVDQDNYTFIGNPTSFTGGGTKMTVPLGIISRESSRLVLAQMFSEGAEVINTLPSNPGQYVAVIQPAVVGYQYAYNQLKNLGFAITPQASVAIQVKLLNEAGDVTFEKVYESGLQESKAYFISTEPQERINELTHQLFVELLTQAAADIQYQVGQ